MRTGINAGFGKQIAHELPFLASIGFDFVRQDLRADFTDDWIKLLVAEFVGAPLAPLFLLAGGHIEWPGGTRRVEPHEIAALAVRTINIARELGVADYMLEVGNEPDIAHRDYQHPHESDFAAAICQTRDTARNEGFTGTIISGGVRNLNREGLGYLEAVMRAGVPDDITIGFHRYPHGIGPKVPHPGFSNRDDEWRKLTQLAGGRPVACTEFGHNTAPRKTGLLGRKERISDAQVADDVEFDLAFFRAKGCTLAALYQLNDGVNAEVADDRYGIRTLDGRSKPVVSRLGEHLKQQRA